MIRRGGMKMKTEAWWNLCKTIIAGILIAAAAVIGFKYLLPPLFPFIIALVVSSFIRPAAVWCRKHLGLGSKPVSVIMILGILVLLCLLIWAAGSRLVEETAKFLVNITDNSTSPDSPIYRLMKMIEGIREKLPLPEENESAIDLYEIATELIRTGTSKISSALASSAASFIKKLPAAILSTGICFIALFYLTLDYDGASSAVRTFLPSDIGEKIISGYRRVSRALGEYLRSYLLIMLITFAELYLGFTLLRVEYSLLFAVVIALVDFLPLLGVGTVLIPWGGAALLLGNYRLGIGILVIYAVVCVVRQFIEPRIVGKFIGTHPVVALAGVYAGLKLFGFAGMIAAPIILYLVRALQTETK